MVPTVFISYAQEDARLVERKLVRFLSRNGARLCTGLLPQQQPAGATIEADARAWIIVALSPRSVDSEALRADLDWVLSNRGPGKILCVRLAECDPGRVHAGLVELPLIDLHANVLAGRQKLLTWLGLDVPEPRGPAGPARSDLVRFLGGRADEEKAGHIVRQLDEPGSGTSRLLSAIASQSQRALRREFAEADALAQPLPRAVAAFWETIRGEAQARALQRLTDLVAELGERVRATSAWLFDKKGDALEAIVTHRTRRRHLVMRLGQRGIVPHVAATGAGYCAGDVADDPHYTACIADTRSEVAVPVKALDGEVVGVLNLESRHRATFRPAQIDELQTAAAVLLPHLLVLAGLEECPWHPEVHGWDLTEIFQRLCYAVAEGLNRPDGEDTAACTIWYADWPKEELFVYATSGYDFEYRSELTLPLGSFTGTVASGPRGTVWDHAPAEAPHFRRLDKAEQTGLKRVLAAPIYLPGEHQERRAVSTLNLYFFSERDAGALPSQAGVCELADSIGRLITSFRRQRTKVATAHLHQELLVQAQSSDAAFQTLKQVLSDFFKADGCTIFGHNPHEGRLYCVTTTGLDARGPVHADEFADAPPGKPTAKAAFYDLDDDKGFTTYLAQHFGTCARKNDVISTTEKGLPPGFPSRPLNKYCEKFARSETDHRRFLGVGVGLADASLFGEAVLGVIRLNRASSSRAFTWCDEMLLRDVAALGLCKRAFLDWRARLPPRPVTAGAAPPGPKAIDAFANFMRPIPVLVSSSTLRDELLQALTGMLRDHKIHSAALLLADRPPHELALRAHGYHSEYHKRAPAFFATADRGPGCSEFLLAEHDIRLLGEQVFRRRKVVTFDHDPTWCEDGHAVVSEAWVPVVAWNGRHLLEGALALAFQTKVADWSRNALVFLFHASRKLSAILTSTPHVIRPECFRLPAGVALERFLSFSYEEEGIGSDWAELRLKDGDQLRTVARRGPESAAPAGPWRPLQPETPGDEAAFGIQERLDGRAFSLPLRLGPYAIGDLRCGFDRADCKEGLGRLIRTVPGLWSRLSFGMCTFWEVSFEPQPIAPGLTVWQEQLVVQRPMTLDESRPWTRGRPSLVADS